jgi:hypothetical protein
MLHNVGDFCYRLSPHFCHTVDTIQTTGINVDSLKLYRAFILIQRPDGQQAEGLYIFSYHSPRVRVGVGGDLRSTPIHARQLVNGLCSLKCLYKIRRHCAASLSAAAWHERRQIHLRSYGTLRQLSRIAI